MLHELGHCLLYRNHDNSSRGSIPKTIMNAYVLKRETFVNNTNYYYHELIIPDFELGGSSHSEKSYYDEEGMLINDENIPYVIN